eukprot:1414831-Alexandrium_andersonii.AAC.1
MTRWHPDGHCTFNARQAWPPRQGLAAGAKSLVGLAAGRCVHSSGGWRPGTAGGATSGRDQPLE